MYTFIEEVLVRIETNHHGDEPLSGQEVLEEPGKFALSKRHDLRLVHLLGSEFRVVFEGGDTLAQSHEGSVNVSSLS